MKYLTCSFFLIFITSAQARVFSLADQAVASYFKGFTSPSGVLQTPFAGTMGSGSSVVEKYGSSIAGEVGVVFTSTQAAFSLGVELIHPKALSHVDGVDSASQVLYNLDADVSALIPKAGLDFIIKKGDHSRFYLNMSGGVGTLTYSNHYAFTAAGQTAFANLADFTEEGAASATLMEASLGYEQFLSDSTTMVFEGGYRQLNFSAITYKTAITDFSGAHAKGDNVLNLDGTPKTINFTGSFAALTFRFYLR